MFKKILYVTFEHPRALGVVSQKCKLQQSQTKEV
jgi:hypothetical protein